MTVPSNKPELRQIGESALTEVLGTLLSLSATDGDSVNLTLVSGAPDQITSSVVLTGARLSGSVHLRLPQAFVTRAVQILTGARDVEGDAAVLNDAAGEIANMVAGRIAVQLAADGYPCTLSTPSVVHNARLPTEGPPGIERGRTQLVCEGHPLSLEIRCRYVVP